MSPAGLIIAAPSSNSGKTLITLGLLRHWKNTSQPVASAKIGPDYIDPAFHTAASGSPCLSLDSWAMRPDTLNWTLERLEEIAPFTLCEGVMGLFDGTFASDPARDGSTAAIAACTGWPVVLVLDVKGQAASAAAVLDGFARHRPGVRIGGVIFNRVGGAKHQALLTAACRKTCPDIPVLGALPVASGLHMPSRHLGLVQALEHPDLASFLDAAARLVGEHIDTGALRALAVPSSDTPDRRSPFFPPLGQRIAVARDAAFSFFYPGLAESWRQARADLLFFSPLDDQSPAADADAVYLPGGYPELHAGRLAANTLFAEGVRSAARRNVTVFGECGGYIALGEGLTDADGVRHPLLGLLPLETDFSRRRLHLGYRRATLLADTPLGRSGEVFRGHEFHYTTIAREEGSSLFHVEDAAENPLGPAGLHLGTVYASFLHLIDRESRSP